MFKVARCWPCFIFTLLFSQQALSHSAERGLVLLLPTNLYVIGGSLTVLASFMLLAVISADSVSRMVNARIKLLPCRPPTGTFTSLVGFAVLTALLYCGFFGSNDPLSNPLPLAIWTGWWGIFSVLQFLIGDLWKYINPWQGPAHLIRKAFRLKNSYLILPKSLGYLPAILLFCCFAWFELVYISPEDPARLGTAVFVYWLINFAAVMIYGKHDWFARGEPFSIFFRLVGSLSPVQRGVADNDKDFLFLVMPGRALSQLPAMPGSGVLFVLISLGTVSFDGLARTFFWLGLTGVNPLEFPGRSAVIVENSIGLMLALVVLAALFYTCIYLGCRVTVRQHLHTFGEAVGRLVYAIIPISLVFHVAHYLSQILVNGQYLLISLNDPLSKDWNLLNLDGDPVTTSFLNHLETVTAIWTFQTTVIVTGHVIGVVIAHAIALEIYKDVRLAFLSQVFFAMLMVMYSIFGLWLLSTAAIG